MKTLLAGAAALAVAGGIAVSAPAHAVSDDEAFLRVVNMHPGFRYQSAADEITTGHQVCTGFRKGFSYSEVTLWLSQTGISRSDSNWFIGAAVGAYCPELDAVLPS
jgi:hypothetical protein